MRYILKRIRSAPFAYRDLLTNETFIYRNMKVFRRSTTPYPPVRGVTGFCPVTYVEIVFVPGARGCHKDIFGSPVRPYSGQFQFRVQDQSELNGAAASLGELLPATELRLSKLIYPYPSLRCLSETQRTRRRLTHREI